MPAKALGAARILFSIIFLYHMLCLIGYYSGLKFHDTKSHIPYMLIDVCLFSWRYNPLCLYFHSPVEGFSLLVFEVS